MYRENIEKLKIVIIGFYYGKFPDWMPYWLRSCADNPSVDFIIITDIDMGTLPENVKKIDIPFDKLKALFKKKLKMEIVLDKPYKLCDYRPLYGILLDDYVKSYDYWGHCDFDLIWGNIRGMAEKYHIERYDKFLSLGHLSLYRNTDKVNNYYKLNGSKCGDYKTILSKSDNFAFDEIDGIYSIYEYNKFPMFKKRIFAEIKTFHKRFRLKRCDRNYKHQAFYYANGKVFRAYNSGGGTKLEEYIYIHFRRKLPSDKKRDWKELQEFYITPKGFFDKKTGIPSLDEIERYNHNPGVVKEFLETIYFCLKNITKVKSKIQNEIIAWKGMR